MGEAATLVVPYDSKQHSTTRGVVGKEGKYFLINEKEGMYAMEISLIFPLFH